MSKEKVKRLKQQIEAIIIAIPREQAAYEFYMEMSEGTDGADTKEMFIFLAKQESMHKERLEEILKQLQNELSEMS